LTQLGGQLARLVELLVEVPLDLFELRDSRAV
jgi:hypothetical protein